jgi:8-oxo-dGTP pyrophosphatase MutT (NUDIX family)
MRQRRKRVYAYITNQGRLLVFAHPNSPSAGIQVPAGTVEPGEDPNHAVLREAEEETGLSDLVLGAFLGKLERDMCEFGTDEIQEAWFYHLTCPGIPPHSWSHDETSCGRVDPIQFDFFWASLPDGLPELIALNGAMLDELYEAMGQIQDEVNIPGSTSPLETDRLILRAFRLSDFQAVCGIFGDAEVMGSVSSRNNGCRIGWLNASRLIGKLPVMVTRP